MNSLIEYKGYHAKIEYSAEDSVFVGRVIGINDVLSFDGETVDELKMIFQETIDDYLDMCNELGTEPDKEYKGTFNVRISPELHKKAVLEAEAKDISLNQFVATSIENEINGVHCKEKETLTFYMPAEMLSEYNPEIFGNHYDINPVYEEGGYKQWQTTAKLSLSV